MGWWPWGKGGGGTSSVTINGAGLGNALMDLLSADDIQPGDEPSYQTCKTIFAYHTLGRKMTESPVKMAQSQPREITVQDHPEEVVEAFKAEAQALGTDRYILNAKTLSRVYGASTLILGCVGKPSNEPLDMTQIWNEKIYFNVLDPLNTAGSLVLSQIPGTPDFQRPITVRTNGQTYHPSRFQVVMNGEPLYIEYTNSAFGYVGRSVYQPALFQLKSFINTQIADDMIATKLGVFVAMIGQPGSIATEVMAEVAGLKRSMIKGASTWNVLSVGKDEKIETLNMQNVDGAGKYSRGNVLKNIATAADMPAVLLENETMVEGFGEGTEDAKVIAAYIESIRIELQPLYGFTDNIVQYRAWSPEFFKRMQKLYPEQYGSMEFDEAFSEWRRAFHAEWPNLLREAPSEKAKLAEIQLQSLLDLLQVVLPVVDPFNKVVFIRSAMDNLAADKTLFPNGWDDLDYEAMEAYFETQQEQAEEQHEASIASDEESAEPVKKLAKIDAAHQRRVRSSKARELLDALVKKQAA